MNEKTAPNNGSQTKQNATFHAELTALINTHSLEGGSDMADFIIADFLCGCLDSLNQAATHSLAWESHGTVEGVDVVTVGRE